MRKNAVECACLETFESLTAVEPIDKLLGGGAEVREIPKGEVNISAFFAFLGQPAVAGVELIVFFITAVI